MDADALCDDDDAFDVVLDEKEALDSPPVLCVRLGIMMFLVTVTLQYRDTVVNYCNSTTVIQTLTVDSCNVV